jgi:predicted aldo/keto reductase-like oxidoreductase
MIYREYGRTGHKVSAIGFGGMRFAKPDDFALSSQLVVDAYDAGINYFDTAPGYGKSEDIFGVAFKSMAATRSARPFYVSTKSFADNPSDLRRDLEKSLKRMGLDYVDFFHSWCVMEYAEYEHRRDNGVYEEMEKLKAEGLIRHICVSSHMDGSDIAKMLSDYDGFEGVLLGCSAMNFSYREKGVDAAAKSGRGVVVRTPRRRHDPAAPGTFRLPEDAGLRKRGRSGLALPPERGAYHLPLVGIADGAQLKEALRAVDGFKPIPAERIERMRGELSESMNSLCTNCNYCAGCPRTSRFRS